MSLQAALKHHEPHILGLLRLVSAYLFIFHGTTKLFQWPYIEMFANVSLTSIYGLAAIIEVVGGVLLLLGCFTRPVAFILSGQMAVAYFIGHVSTGGNVLMPILNQGELAVMWSFVFLYFTFAGAGSFSIDKWRQTS